jgi:phosphotransferase system  glucose/maltose/N-acetylglucosamine-specific IIC component
MKAKSRSHLVLPPALLVYAGIMAYVGRSNLQNPSTRLTYIISILVEIGVIIALYFFLKRRNKLRSEREADCKSKN